MADPFPTIKMSVPHLKELLDRLRDESLQRSITVLHVEREDEGEWILANAAARLARSRIPTVGPESARPAAIAEQALRANAKVALMGEIRRPEDAEALRGGAALGLRTVGIITAEMRSSAEQHFVLFGPWDGYDVAFLSRQPKRR